MQHLLEQPREVIEEAGLPYSAAGVAGCPWIGRELLAEETFPELVIRLGIFVRLLSRVMRRDCVIDVEHGGAMQGR